MTAKRKMGIVREYAESIIIAIIIALFIRAFIVQAFKIPSGSMEPTLLIGDHLLVNKFKYGVHIPFTEIKFFDYHKPQRGDIIVFTYPVDQSKDFIKRVIGLPGETIEIRKKKIYINNKLFAGSYGTYRDPDTVTKVPRDNFGPVVVPENHVFVMGDNRDRSYDSRFWGFVEHGKIKGKAWIIYWSWDSQAKKLFQKVRVGRFAHLIH
ncbi:MAG: signal peptidase I [Pseudomonadota bacterium]|nr:signal peptidase I [Pseudomonadota bacterium]